jgi:hypothetical protein
MRHPRHRRWHLGRAFLLGAFIGALAGAVWSWIDYGGFDVAYMSNHVLGGVFMSGVAFAAVAGLLNWRRRNPL